MMRRGIVFVFVLWFPVSVFAQTRSAPLHDAVERQATTLARTQTPEPQSAPAPTRSWVAQHQVLTGALIGLGVGIPIGVVTCRYPTAEGSSCSDYTFPGNARMLGGLTMGALGAGIGAGVGALIAAIDR